MKVLHRLNTASIDPTYLFFILTDLVWGAVVAFGSGFHEDISAYNIINSDAIGWLMIVLGVVGILNFSTRCNKWLILVHAMFNIAFYAFITLVQFHLNDGAYARNAVVLLLSGWLMFRLTGAIGRRNEKTLGPIEQSDSTD